MRTHNAALILAVAAAGAACAAPASLLAQGANSREATIEVQNDRNVPVTLFIEGGDFDVRVGKVGAMRTATLALPAWAAQRGDIEMFVHPDGELDLASQPFHVTPGARLAMMVQRGSNPVWPVDPKDTMSAVLPAADLNEPTLTVENPRSAAVTVFLEQGDFDVRLGSVNAKSTKTLRLPPGWANEHSSVDIFVEPAHGIDLASQRLELSAHSHLGLRVPMP